jgi:endonuclease/exonuclease/phosphatase family metal-dependent hydrolase
VVDPAEGLAILSRGELRRTSTFSLRHAPFWDWRRRIGLGAIVAIDGRDVGIVDIHLSPHDEAERRRREADRTLARTAPGPPAFIVGDLNDCPGAGAHAAFLAAGWIDAWSAVHGEADGPTNWTAGDRAGRPPTQRIDYVLAPPGSTVEACSIAADPERYDVLAAISDHLPLAATVRLPDTSAGEA